MYQLTLSLKERQELVHTLYHQINHLRVEKKIYQTQGHGELAQDTEERIAHLENIKMKVENAKISPVKGLTE